MSAVETLGAKPAGPNNQDCACPQPTTATLASAESVQVLNDCASPKPTTATLETGTDLSVKQQFDDCACPDVAPVVIGVETLPAVKAPAPAIRINVVVPQA